MFDNFDITDKNEPAYFQSVKKRLQSGLDVVHSLGRKCSEKLTVTPKRAPAEEPVIELGHLETDETLDPAPNPSQTTDESENVIHLSHEPSVQACCNEEKLERARRKLERFKNRS